MTHTTGTLECSESPYEANRYSINVKGHHWLMSILHNGEQLEFTQRENLRRLVACWNACQGISTQSLEENGVASMEKIVEMLNPGLTSLAGSRRPL